MHKIISLLAQRHSVLILIALSLVQGVYAQSTEIRLVQTCGSQPLLGKHIIQNEERKPDSQVIDEFIKAQIGEDKLEAALDSISLDSVESKLTAYIHLGPKYSFDEIRLDSVSSDLLKRINIKSPRTTAEFLEIRQQLIDYYADRGYPFAVVRLRDMQLQGGKVSGQLQVDEGNLVTLSEIVVNGKVQLRKSYLENYLDFRKGDAYNHSLVKDIQAKLDRLRFLRTTDTPQLSFIYDYASLNLFLEDKNTSRFDLIFGVIPTSNIDDRQLFLSMDFTTELLNKLGYGEYIFLKFERLRPEQQKLNLRFNYPYLLDTPFAIDVDFEIFRLSLDYQTVKSNLGLQYLINSTDNLKVSWVYEGSRIVEVDTVSLLATRQLPDDLSVTQSGLAVEANIFRVDYRFNPRRGYAITLGATGGQRRILLDQNILQLSNDQVDFGALYEELDLVSSRFEVRTDIAYYRPIGRRGTIMSRLRGGWRLAPGNELLRNEKFQIGGNKLLKGFDEASIFTSYYGLTTFEYRLLLSQNSYFSAPFIDVGYIEVDGRSELAIGLGAGLVAETKVGMFNFSVAVGRNQSQPFDFSKPKAHFGFVSLF